VGLGSDWILHFWVMDWRWNVRDTGLNLLDKTHLMSVFLGEDCFEPLFLCGFVCSIDKCSLFYNHAMREMLCK